MIALLSVVSLAKRREVVVVVNEDVVASHEVRVALDSGVVVKPREHSVQERLLLRCAAGGAELRHTNKQKIRFFPD